MQNLFVAGSVKRVHRSERIDSAQPCRSVDVPRRIQRNSAQRTRPVRQNTKPVEHTLDSAGRDSKHSSASLPIASLAAVLRSTVESSSRIFDQPRIRPRAVFSGGEAVDYRFISGRVDLEHSSMPVSPAVPSCAIQVPGGIQNEPRCGIPSVSCAAEVVQHSFRTAGVDFVDCSTAVVVNVASRAGPAEEGGSVEIAGRIAGHSSLGPASIRKIAAAVKWIKQSEVLRRNRSNQKQSRKKRK